MINPRADTIRRLVLTRARYLLPEIFVRMKR